MIIISSDLGNVSNILCFLTIVCTDIRNAGCKVVSLYSIELVSIPLLLTLP